MLLKSQITLHIQMAYRIGVELWSRLMEFFFHEAQVKQLKREESSTICSIKK